jgi:uncharacterized protein YdeI (YjbR/CyaY-like superfamily)
MAIGGKIQRFEARLELLRDGLGWTVVRVPFVPGVVWKTMIRLRVRGEVNGFAFRNSLFPFTTGGYFLLVNRAMQQGGQVRLGEVGEFVLEPDMEPRPAELPDELAALLDEEEGLRAFYDSFSESMRREAGKWVLLAKGDEARMRRAEQMAERFLFAMEGERELPPILVAAFGRRPKAKAGWEKMTPLQRRQGLMAVAYYQSPEAKAKRVEKLCEEAEKREAESRE